MKGKFNCEHRTFQNNDPIFIAKIQAIEIEIGDELTANDMCRCPDCNLAVGGEKHSAHMIESNSNHLSCAGDFQVDAVSLPKIMDAARKHGITRFGILRKSGQNGYVHMDIGSQGDGFEQNRIWTY